MKKIHFFLVPVIFIALCSPALADPTSGDISYATSFDGTQYTYYLTVSNTSDPGYGIRNILFGYQYLVTYPDPPIINNGNIISSPSNWTGHNSTFGPTWSTTDVYAIPSGNSLSGFVFTCLTTPPAGGVPFGLNFVYGNVSGFSYNGIATYTGSINPVPEPSTMLLLGSGLVGLIGFSRRFKK